MSDEHLGSRLAALLRTLKPKTKEPVSTKVLFGLSVTGATRYLKTVEHPDLASEGPRTP